MSLNSVVNNLVRAAAGIPADISDTELDRHVSELLAKEAKEKEMKWSEIGLGGLLGSSDRGTPDPNAPKPNKRFLASVIRTVDTHNSSVIRQQLEAAETARSQSGLGESSRSAANRLFGGAMRDAGKRSGGRERDRGRPYDAKGKRELDERHRSRRERERSLERWYDKREASRERRTRYDQDEEEEMINEGWSGVAERKEKLDWMKQKEERDRRRRRERERERERERDREHDDRSGDEREDRRRRAALYGEDEEGETRRARRRNEHEDEEDTSRRSRRRDGPEEASRSKTRRREDKTKGENGGEDLPRERRRRRDSTTPEPARADHDDRSSRKSRRGDEVHETRPSRRSKRDHDETEPRDLPRRSRSRSPKIASRHKGANGESSRASRRTECESPQISRDRSPPTKPDRSGSSKRPRSPEKADAAEVAPPPPDMAPPPPDSPPPPPPPPVASKMDKYFKADYDPRLDLGEVPRDGYVPEVGWDNMLAILKERGKKPRNRSPGLYDNPLEIPKVHLQRTPSPTLKEIEKAERRAKRAARGFDDDVETEAERAKRKAERKKEKEERARVTQLGPGDGGGLFDVSYVKKGGVREWDMGK